MGYDGDMTTRSNLFVRLGKLGDHDDKVADYEYWRSVSDEARYQAAWELVIQAHELQGKDLNELRFQRSVANLVRKRG